jgi:hypothetical protein
MHIRSEILTGKYFVRILIIELFPHSKNDYLFPKKKSSPINVVNIFNKDDHRMYLSSNFTVILSFLKRERDVILQTFQTIYLLQYERFRPSNVTACSPFLSVS